MRIICAVLLLCSIHNLKSEVILPQGGGGGSGSGLASLPVSTNGVLLANATSLDFVAGVTGYVSGATARLGTTGGAAAGGAASGGFVSGITNIGYATTNVFIDLAETNYSVFCVTNTGGPVNLLFTNLTLGFNWTVLIDGIDLDGTTSASNALVSYVWPHASVAAQWLGFTTNTYVTSNKVLGVTGFIRRTNSVIISSRE